MKLLLVVFLAITVVCYSKELKSSGSYSYQENCINEAKDVIQKEADRMKDLLDKPWFRFINSNLTKTFLNTYENNIETTMQFLNDNSTFVVTGDIPNMWLRDSAAQVDVYLPLVSSNDCLRKIIEGVVMRQIFYILNDSYANSFSLDPFKPNEWERSLSRGGYITTYNYEVDSLCYFIRLSYRMWKMAGSVSFFNDDFLKVLNVIVSQWEIEQDHENKSPYRYSPLPRNGLGVIVKSNIGLTWSGFRPSDDECKHGYNIPQNMMAVVALQQMQEITENFYHQKQPGLLKRMNNLATVIDDAIMSIGVSDVEGFGKIWAYEVNGFGVSKLMDDANVPSLLSVPYLGYLDYSPSREKMQLYSNTRRFVLSSGNPYFFNGSYAAGIGSPHTGRSMDFNIPFFSKPKDFSHGMTSNDRMEKKRVLEMLLQTTAGTYNMHESFDPDNPNNFTRKWFGWANSLFAKYIFELVRQR